MKSINGTWIKCLRERLDLTQSQFAQRLCVSQGTVARWENNDFLPTGPARRLLEIMALEVGEFEAEKISA